MKHIKKISFAAAAVLLIHTAAIASDASFVNSDEKPGFNIFSIFSKKATYQSSIKTSVTQNTGEFAALGGTLNVIVNTPATGSMECNVPAEEEVMFDIETPPTKGDVEITDTSNGDFTYTPHEDETGTDSFVFSVTSDDLGTETATISVTISEEPEESPEPSPEESPEESPEPSPEESPEPTPPVYSFRYEDMFNHWGEYSAIRLGERNILKGFQIGNKFYFYPESELSRGDFILYLVSAMGIDVSEYAEMPSPFADAEETPAWMNLQAKAAYDAGIIKGSLEGDKLYLRASEKLTRLESIAMLNNTIKPDAEPEDLPDYTDLDIVPEWGIPYISNMTAYGLVRGYDDGTVRPFAKITRAMAAEMILQTIKYKESNPEVMRQLIAEMDMAS